MHTCTATLFVLISIVSGIRINHGDNRDLEPNTDMMEIKKELLKLSEKMGSMQADMKIMNEQIVAQNSKLDTVVANMTQFEEQTEQSIKDMKQHMVSNETDCNNSAFTYYPLGTTENKICMEYPSLKLKFIGYSVSSYDDYIVEYKLSFWECVEKCTLKRLESGTSWNGITWFWGSGKCVCKTYDGSPSPSTDNVHYRFEK